MKLIHFLCLLMITGMTSHEDQGVVRLKARVGEAVILPCSLGPENNIKQALFGWWKDGQEVFLYNADFNRTDNSQFKGRVFHFPDQLQNGNASIIIRNLQLSDSGTYSCYFQRPQHRTFYVELVVGITAMKVREDDDVILNCSFGATNIENGAFTWKKDVDKSNEEVFWFSDGQTDPGKEFRGRVSHFRGQLRFGNASIKITKAKRSDSGNYTCYHATVKKEVKSTVSLTVDSPLKPRPEIEGAAPQPILTSDKSNNEVLLKCEVKGASPKPVVEWWDRDGNILPADKPQIKPENKDDVIITITVMSAGFYRCVATQKEIYHQIETLVVVLHGGPSKPHAKAIENTKDGVLLQCEVFGASPELKVFWKTKAGQDVSTKEPQKTENSIILQTTVTKTDYYRCVTTEGKKDDEVYDEIHVVVPGGPPWGWIIGFIVAVIVAAAFGVLYFCESKRLRSIMRAERRDSGFSFRYSSHDPERRDSGNSSLFSPFDPAKPEETRKLNQKAEPDKAVKISMDEL